MTFIEEVVFSGFVSKAVNNIVDFSWTKMKKAVKEQNKKHQNLESQIYNVIIDVLNEITDNLYEDNQDKIYDAAEVLLESFKNNEKDESESIKICLRVLDSPADENECLKFKQLLYQELGKNEYIELFHTVILSLLEQKNKYDYDVYEQLNQKLDDINLNLNKLNQKLDKSDNYNESNIMHVKATKFQNNKKQDYIKNWNSRLFLHIDNEENPLTLADTFIMPDYKINNKIKRIGFSYDDTLDSVIGKFVEYDKTSTMLIMGVPGIGKSSIVSWISHKYKDDDRFIILRFRDWKKEDLNKGLIETVIDTLNCTEKDLDNKVLILDGFDEMKTLDIRNELLDLFFEDILDFYNLKCIITSRTNYIDRDRFDNVLEIKKFNAYKVIEFCRKIDGRIYDVKKILKISNIEVLGVPVILYMALMCNIDITQNASKTELYSHIFSKKGGIFDRFAHEGIAYSEGKHILRTPANIKIYLKFLREIAFLMFEKNKLVLQKDEYKEPKLVLKKKGSKYFRISVETIV